MESSAIMPVPRPTPPRALPNLYARAINTSHLEADRDEEAHVTATNEALVASGLRALRDPLAVFVCQGIAEKFGQGWWTEGVLEVFIHDRTPTIEDVRKHRKLPASGTIDELADALDINGCLILLTKHWARIFGPALGQDHRGWAYELMGVRNKNKHLGSDDHPSDYAWRALDTMYRLCSSIDETSAAQLLALRSSVDLSAFGQSAAISVGAAESAHETVASPLELPTEGDKHSSADATAEELDLRADLAAAGPDFSGADLRAMNFTGASLAGADFTDADLTDADLSGANLAGAVFVGTQLGNADLTDTDLRGAIFESPTLSVEKLIDYDSTMVGSRLSGATLDGATLNFAGSDLRGTDLRGTNLAGADFTDADLTDADLSGANLAGANLKGANIKTAHTVDVKWA